MSLPRNDINRNIIAVILCAGEGKRFGNITKTIPKPLIKIKSLGNRSILHYTIDLMVKLGAPQILLVKGHLGKKIEEFYEELIENNSPLPEKLILIDTFEQYKLGPLHSFLSITQHSQIFQEGYTYLIIPGDTIFQYDLLKEIYTFCNKQSTVLLHYPVIFYRKLTSNKLNQKKLSDFISIVELEKAETYAYLKQIKRVECNALLKSEESNQIIPVFLFPYHFIQEILRIQNKFPLKTIKAVVNKLIKVSGSKIFAVEMDEDYNFYDIDTPSDLTKLQEL